MKKIALGLGVAAAALSAPAMARDGQGYFGVDAGALFPNEYGNTVTTGTIVREDAVLIESEMGWELGGALGYDFGVIRTELEGSYKEWDPDQLTSPLVGIPRGPRNFQQTGTFPLSGETRLTSVMANALLDFGGDEGIGFSIGGGFGHTWMSGELTAA